MGESRTHMDLVQTVAQHVRTCLSAGDLARMYVDTPDEGLAPMVIGGFRPDVYVRTLGKLIIGEAKTERDFVRPHSISQLHAYYEECRCFDGAAEVVVAVPWTVVRSALNFFRRLRTECPAPNVELVVLDEVGRIFVV